MSASSLHLFKKNELHELLIAISMSFCRKQAIQASFIKNNEHCTAVKKPASRASVCKFNAPLRIKKHALQASFNKLNTFILKNQAPCTANNFGIMYSRKRISHNSFPNLIYIFPKAFMIFCQELQDSKRNYENQI